MSLFQPRPCSPIRTSGAISRRRGFTLVELLVVIGIIALLISILLPALNGARKKAQAVACASNMRQIYMAMVFFSQEHKGHLPRPFLVGELSSNPQIAEVCAWAQKVPGASGHIDLQNDKGALWPYIKGQDTRAKLLMCPGDTGEVLAGHPTMPQYPRNFSYAINWLILRDSGGPSLGLRLPRVMKASDRIMLYEELAPNDTYNITGYSGDDIPSARHGSNDALNALRNPQQRRLSQFRSGKFCLF